MKNAVKYVSILIVVRPLRKFQIDKSSIMEQMLIDWIKIWLENERLLPDQQWLGTNDGIGSKMDHNQKRWHCFCGMDSHVSHVPFLYSYQYSLGQEVHYHEIL